jgi:hypothetical protein
MQEVELSASMLLFAATRRTADADAWLRSQRANLGRDLRRVKFSRCPVLFSFIQNERAAIFTRATWREDYDNYDASRAAANLRVLVPARAANRVERACKKISSHDDIHALHAIVAIAAEVPLLIDRLHIAIGIGRADIEHVCARLGIPYERPCSPGIG